MKPFLIWRSIRVAYLKEEKPLPLTGALVSSCSVFKSCLFVCFDQLAFMDMIQTDPW